MIGNVDFVVFKHLVKAIGYVFLKKTTFFKKMGYPFPASGFLLKTIFLLAVFDFTENI